MPERNLVCPNLFKVFVVVISIGTLQTGCSKLHNFSAFINNDFLAIEAPDSSAEPELTDVGKTLQQPETQGRFVNDPQIALDELLELRGELVEDVSMEEDPSDIIDEVTSEVIFVAQETSNRELSNRENDFVSPPAPPIKDSIESATTGAARTLEENLPASNQFETSSNSPISQTNNSSLSGAKRLDVMAAAAVREPLRLTPTTPSQLRPDNPAAPITAATPAAIKLSAMQPLSPQPEQENSPGDCGHVECDCMKPKLKPELPYAEPIAFPQPQSLPTPTGQRPLAPIFHEGVNQINDQAKLRANLLRTELKPMRPSNPNIPATQSQTAQSSIRPRPSQQRMNAFEPISATPENPIVATQGELTQAPRGEIKTALAEVNSIAEIPKTEYPGFKPQLLCQSCQLNQCDGSCVLRASPTATQFNVKQTGFVQSIPSEPIESENVVIVATMNNETFPPFAEHPEMDQVAHASFTPQPTEVAPAALIDSALTESQIQRTHTNGVAADLADASENEKPENQNLNNQEWAEVVSPAITSTQEASVKARCSECAENNFVANCNHQLVNSDFAPPTSIDVPDNNLSMEIPNKFILSQSSPASHQTEIATSDFAAWKNPDNNATSASWVAPVTTKVTSGTELIEGSNPKPLASPAPETAPANSKATESPRSDLAETTEVPVNSGDTLLPSDESTLVAEVIDNTVPWDLKLAETIANVRSQVTDEVDPLTRNGMEVNLRLLEVLQRQLRSTEKDQTEMANPERDYWQHQLDAISMMLPQESDASEMDRHNAAYQTLHHLRKAVERLEAIAKLSVANGAFCSEISGFGKFTPFSSNSFKPGQRTLVYCEVENYLSNARVENFQTNFHTKLRGSYVVYDEQGRAVQQAEYPIVEDVVRQRRRDFYLYFPIQIGELPPGNYRLDLRVEDLGNNKTASLNPEMKFQVVN